MTFATLLANWPWAAAYVTVAGVVLFWLRKHGSTDGRAAAIEDKTQGFGPSMTLWGACGSFFQLTCARLLVMVVAFAWTARVAIGGWNLWDAAIMAGVIGFWPLQEWLVHVFLLHLKPFTLLGRRIDPIVSRNHRNHHHNPWDAELGITPAHIVWLYAAGLPAVWLPVLPVPQALTGVAIYMTLLLNYEWVHLLIHTSYVPKTWFYRRLWKNHRLHHFKNEHFWYGVTMLGGDRLMHTQPSSVEAPRSETCLDMGAEETARLTEPVAHRKAS